MEKTRHLQWSEPLSIETTIKSIRRHLIDKRDENTVTILHSIIPATHRKPYRHVENPIASTMKRKFRKLNNLGLVVRTSPPFCQMPSQSQSQSLTSRIAKPSPPLCQILAMSFLVPSENWLQKEKKSGYANITLHWQSNPSTLQQNDNVKDFGNVILTPTLVLRNPFQKLSR